MKCPIPKPATKIVTAAGSPRMVQCENHATVTTLAPFTDRGGNTHFQFVQTCLHHAISIACWKLIGAIDEQLRLAQRTRRIQLI
jgi:hypothetical protein